MVTHGFVVDEDGKKMSKSVGNTILPQDIIKESGAEIIRLWVAMVDFREEVRLGKQILARVVEAYRKLRNTCRYLLANLYDFDPAIDAMPLAEMQEVDRYALARYGEVAVAVLDAYRDYDFPTIFQRVNQFVTVDLSAFYADVSKDRLYTFAAGSSERRSAQTAMFVIADGLVRMLAPILAVTADELWRHLPGEREDSVHMAEFPSRESVAALLNDELVGRWERLSAVRDQVNAALEIKRQDKTIGTSLGARVTLRAEGETADLLRQHLQDLPMLFIVSQVELEAGTSSALDIAVAKADGEKCGRCWRIVPSVSAEPATAGLCDRCIDAGARAADAVAS